MDKLPEDDHTPLPMAMPPPLPIRTKKREIEPVEKSEPTSEAVPKQKAKSSGGKRELKCPKCGKEYKSPGGLWDHERHSKSCGTMGPRIRPSKKRKSEPVVEPVPVQVHSPPQMGMVSLNAPDLRHLSGDMVISSMTSGSGIMDAKVVPPPSDNEDK